MPAVPPRPKVHGLIDIDAKRDRDYHRTYNVKWLVEVDDPRYDGPDRVGTAIGLASIGDPWIIGREYDPYAVCTPEMVVRPHNTKPNELTKWYTATQTFTTKPLKQKDENPDNPLLSPPRTSGSFVTYRKEALADKDGNPIFSSSLERFKGPAVERDYGNHQVSIEMNVGTLPLSTYTQYMHNVNNASLWGLSARMVKLSNVTWSKEWYDQGYSSFYYKVTLDFDIDFNTFTRYILDEGTQVLKSGGSINNPEDFEPYMKDGQPARVILNGAGAAITDQSQAYYHQKFLYPESNLLLLGIPTSL